MVGFKTAALAAGAGSVLVGGGGLVLWRLGSSAFSEPKNNETPLVGTERDLRDKKITFGTQDCFRDFFPGVEIKHQSLEKTGDNSPYKLDEGSLTEFLDTKLTPKGCANIDFSYEVNGPENEQQKWALRAEVVVKNDKFGWALWVSGGSFDDANRAIVYRLALLTYTNKTWSVAGGYGWKDRWFANTLFDSSKMHIIIPSNSGEREDWGDVFRNVNQSTSGNRKYSGSWEYSESGSKEVFEGIELWVGDAGDKSSNAEILGLEPQDKKEGVNFKRNNVGYDSASYFYDKDGGWMHFKEESQTELIDAALNTLYEPFRGKRGVWKVR